jgi:hypothetical protein
LLALGGDLADGVPEISRKAILVVWLLNGGQQVGHTTATEKRDPASSTKPWIHFVKSAILDNVHIPPLFVFLFCLSPEPWPKDMALLA